MSKLVSDIMEESDGEPIKIPVSEGVLDKVIEFCEQYVSDELHGDFSDIGNELLFELLIAADFMLFNKSLQKPLLAKVGTMISQKTPDEICDMFNIERTELELDEVKKENEWFDPVLHACCLGQEGQAGGAARPPPTQLRARKQRGGCFGCARRPDKAGTALKSSTHIRNSYRFINVMLQNAEAFDCHTLHTLFGIYPIKEVYELLPTWMRVGQEGVPLTQELKEIKQYYDASLTLALDAPPFISLADYNARSAQQLRDARQLEWESLVMPPDKVKMVAWLRAKLDLHLFKGICQGGLTLDAVPPRLTAVTEVVLVAVKRDYRALEDASDALKIDREFMLAVVKQNYMALQFASDELKIDRVFMLAAVKLYGNALYYASEALRGDREVVLAAVEHDGYAMHFASNELREDAELVLAARRARQQQEKRDA